MRVHWSKNAVDSFNEELEFISLKWGNQQVLNFIDLVDEHLELLKSGIFLGAYSFETNAIFLVVSKQTTLIYRVESELNTIHLLLFWNNKRNPKAKNIIT